MKTIVFALSMALLLGSCCAWSHSCKSDDTAGQIATDAIDCTVAAFKDEAVNLMPAVMAILKGHMPDWAKQLDVLKGVGVQALACAVQAATQELFLASQAPTSEPAAPPEVLQQRAVAAEAHRSGAEYLKANKWTFKDAAK